MSRLWTSTHRWRVVMYRHTIPAHTTAVSAEPVSAEPVAETLTHWGAMRWLRAFRRTEQLRRQATRDLLAPSIWYTFRIRRA